MSLVHSMLRDQNLLGRGDDFVEEYRNCHATPRNTRGQGVASESVVAEKENGLLNPVPTGQTLTISWFAGEPIRPFESCP